MTLPYRYPVFAVVACALVYAGIHSVLRLSLSESIPIDSAWENIFTQEFRLQYTPRNPPLYTWLLYGIQKVLPPTLPSFLFLKYTLWTLTAVFLFKAVSLVTKSITYGFVAAGGLLLVYQISWNAHEGVTQTALLSTVLAASLWAWSHTLLHKRGFYWLLVCACIGLLAKYSYLAFLACAVGSCLMTDRQIFRKFQFWLLFAIPFVVFGIAYYVVIWSGSIANTTSSFQLDIIAGFVKVIPAWFGFLFPLIVVLFILDHRFFRKPSHTLPERWALWFMVAGFSICLIIGSLSPDSIRERYMHVFLFPFFIWAIPKLTLTDIFTRYFKYAILATTALVLVVRFIGLADGTEITCGKKCRNLVPYTELYQALQPYQTGTFISTNEHISGNLRALFPEARILWIPSFAITLKAPCVHIETADEQIHTVKGEWDSLLQPKGYRSSYWSVTPDPACTLIP